MLRPGVDEDGHRQSSRERLRSESSTTETTQTTEATSVGEEGQSQTQDAAGKAVKSESEKGEVGNAKAVSASKNVSMDELTTSMSSMKMVPRSVTFGKRKGRSGFAKS